MPQQLLLRVRVLEALLDLLIPELQLHFMLGMMPPAATAHRILPNDWAQLNSDLNFLANNDEHADIAAGNTVIDESLVNEALDSMEPSSEALVAETQAAEVVDKSELHKQLVLMKQEMTRR
ncbi:hypothetical protein B0H14DRAFT_2641985 [Mycena olivaceomarginata]|nr:hypothetical protein B0H14DRAFT_2641985 [Mycena olivaceomarginata]